jgi:hypothetical protein
VKDGFNGDDWASLSPSDRIYRCYWMSEESLRLAEAATPELARFYRELARKWIDLANNVAATEGQPH